MGRGFFSINVQTAGDALPVDGARVRVANKSGEIWYDAYTDRNGKTGVFALYAPAVRITAGQEFMGVAYETYDVTVSKNGFIGKKVNGVEIVDGQTSILPVNLHPLRKKGISPPKGGGGNGNGTDGTNLTETGEYESRNGNPNGGGVNNGGVNNGGANNGGVNHGGVNNGGADDGGEDEADEEINIPPIGLLLPTNQLHYTVASSRTLKDVYIPEYITVHLGTPNNNAVRNVSVRFEDYIKNVASCEIFPSWPLNSILANVHCQVTFALNRVYTEWYRSRGYNFDITNSTAYDQYFVDGRSYYENISNTVDQVFNIYARRIGFQNPYFTQYCNGTTSVCAGLSQWGTVPLAEQGMQPIDILKYYYENDIELVVTENISRITESYPGYSLKLGSTGSDVAVIQNYLRRIRVNYPLIPVIADPDGYFGATTEQAVRSFQSTFNMVSDGIVGRATWYKISFVYVGVIKLGELDSEGERIGIGLNPPTSVLRTGDTGADVLELQFILDAVEPFYSSLPTVAKDSYFGYEVYNAVMEFQRYFGLTADGIVGAATWNMLYSVYKGIFESGTVQIPDNGDGDENDTPPYPGVALRLGDTGPDIRLMQQYLSAIRIVYNSVLPLVVNGEYDRLTEDAVVSFQNEFVLTPDGVIGPVTWRQIVRIYNLVRGRHETIFNYPGTLLRYGSTGADVTTMQVVMNELHNYYPEIPQVAVSGIFDEAFRNAVIAFQRRFGLSPDGIIGPLTWNRAVRARSEATNGTANQG
ncbi:MAG: peptidoglycan-binding protein [Clostridiales bacterium]|nr:peptidoglycan-binding protein [Clostridiales bacterium]